MHEENWTSWVMQTAKKWNDISDVIKNTGIDTIDHDHKTLTEYALRLNQVLDKSSQDFSLSLIKETRELLGNIYQYTKEHFRREERFIRENDLSGFEAQRLEHERILSMLGGISDQFNSGKISIVRHLKVQILDWLVKHINIVDFDTFKLERWHKVIANATNWNDVRVIIRLTGIEEIDEQHKIMTETALEAVSKIARKPAGHIIDRECDNMTAYGKRHFAHENKFMTTYNIKSIYEHNQEHKVFIDRIELYKTQLKEDIGILEAMKKWIVSWWINHINMVDCRDFAFPNWGYQMIDEAGSADDMAKMLKRTGIEGIDKDHLKLLEQTLQLNSLINAAVEGRELQKDEFTGLFDVIYEAAAAHFTREEEIMQKYNMEALNSHREEHIDILNKLKNLRENFLSGRVMLSANFKNMLLEWWINHTNTTDYKTFVEQYEWKS